MEVDMEDSDSNLRNGREEMNLKKKNKRKVSGKNQLKPVWHDPDDDKLDVDGIQHRRTKLEPKMGELYQSRLIQSFEMVYGPTPKWARLDKAMENLEDTGNNEVMDHSEFQRPLSIGKLEIIRVENLNSKRNEGAIIRSVDFHPKNPVGLAAGNDVVSLYQVNGTSNDLIQSISFEDFPLRKAQFCCQGEEIYVSSGLMGHFYCYDMHSGKTRQIKPNTATKHETIRNLIPSPDNRTLLAVGHEGYMYLFSKSSKELIDTWSVNSEVKGVTFSRNGEEMLAQGANGEVYRWNMNTRSCVEKFSGKANFEGTCLAASANYIACGSSTGYVSVFDNQYEAMAQDEVVSCRIKQPLKELHNLVTSITSLKINHSEEILAMASVDKDNAIRLVHLPSRQTFSSFPFVSANYGRCNSIAFSPNSGYIALGSNRGCAYLFRLKHFTSY